MRFVCWTAFLTGVLKLKSAGPGKAESLDHLGVLASVAEEAFALCVFPLSPLLALCPQAAYARLIFQSSSLFTWAVT